MLLVSGSIKCVREFELREYGVRIYGQLWRKMEAMCGGGSTYFLRAPLGEHRRQARAFLPEKACVWEMVL